MNSTIPDCDWKPYEGGDLSAIRGTFEPDSLHRPKRVLGIIFFWVLLPAFGLWYLYRLIFQAEQFHIGAVSGLGLFICFAAPFVFGKALL